MLQQNNNSNNNNNNKQEEKSKKKKVRRTNKNIGKGELERRRTTITTFFLVTIR